MNPTNPLENFYRNTFERDAVKEFMIDTLKEITVEKAFEGFPVDGIQDCRELIDTMFNKLDDIYGIIKEKPISNSK